MKKKRRGDRGERRGVRVGARTERQQRKGKEGKMGGTERKRERDKEGFNGDRK